MTQTTAEITRFYCKTIVGIADGLASKICEENGLKQEPSGGRELGMIPVFEGDFKETLLSLADKRAKTTLHWPNTPPQTYLQAYWTRRRNAEGRIEQKVVILASNYCWARFYAAKELMHCFIDDDGYPASNTVKLVQDLLESVAAGGFILDDCEQATMVDHMAWIGALFYLIPQSWLPAIQRLVDDLSVAFPGSNPYLHVAQILRVPEQMIRVRLHQAASGALVA